MSDFDFDRGLDDGGQRSSIRAAFHGKPHDWTKFDPRRLLGRMRDCPCCFQPCGCPRRRRR